MTTINTLGDLIAHLRLDDRKPTNIVVVEMARISDWLRLCWNAAKSVGYKEACRAYRESTIQAEVDAQANEAEAFHLRCRKSLKATQRSKRSGH